MTFGEIKQMMPHFERWKANIALTFGESYAEKFCTWERFREHIKILNSTKAPERQTAILPESVKAEIRKEQFGGFNV